MADIIAAFGGIYFVSMDLCGVIWMQTLRPHPDSLLRQCKSKRLPKRTAVIFVLMEWIFATSLQRFRLPMRRGHPISQSDPQTPSHHHISGVPRNCCCIHGRLGTLVTRGHGRCATRDVRNQDVLPGGHIRGAEGVESVGSHNGDAERSGARSFLAHLWFVPVR